MRVILLRDEWINDEVEGAIKRLGDRGIRVMREKIWLSFPRSIERMEEILEEEARTAEERLIRGVDKWRGCEEVEGWKSDIAVKYMKPSRRNIRCYYMTRLSRVQTREMRGKYCGNDRTQM